VVEIGTVHKRVFEETTRAAVTAYTTKIQNGKVNEGFHSNSHEGWDYLSESPHCDSRKEELFGRVFLEGKTQRENPKGKKRKTHQKNPKSFS